MPNNTPEMNELRENFFQIIKSSCWDMNTIDAEEATNQIMSLLTAHEKKVQEQTLEKVLTHTRHIRTTITDNDDAVYVDKSETFISEYEVLEMLAKLKESK